MKPDAFPFAVRKSTIKGKWAVEKNGRETGHNKYDDYADAVQKAQALNRAAMRRKKR
jgi:hypothetical protein